MGGAGGAVVHDMQVEIEGGALQPPPTAGVGSEQQGMLEQLGQAQVVGGPQQVALQASLTEESLVQDDGEKQQEQCGKICVLVFRCLYVSICRCSVNVRDLRREFLQ